MEPNLQKLKTDLPVNIYTELQNAILENYSIDTDLKLAYFLAQTSYESGGFKRTVENLNYSASRLLVVFPKYFDETSANEYAGKPEKIANRVYANRLGNGDEASGEGWKYRGRGYIQLTGKSNYKAYGDFKKMDLVSTPDLVASSLALDSAAFFFKTNKIFDSCKDSESATSQAITKKVSGSTSTAGDRYSIFTGFYKKLTAKDPQAEQDKWNLLGTLEKNEKAMLFELLIENRELNAKSSTSRLVSSVITDFQLGKHISDICTCGIDYADNENGNGGNCAHYVCNVKLWNITNQDGIRQNCPKGYAIQAQELKTHCEGNPTIWKSRDSSAQFTKQGLVFGLRDGKAKHVGIVDNKDAIYHYGFSKKMVLKNKLSWWEGEYDALALFERV